MISFLDSKILDLNSVARGVSIEKLMRNAGEALAEVVNSAITPESKVLFVCGRGNNGGDGYAAALHVTGADIASTGRPRSEEARFFASMNAANVIMDAADVDFSQYDVIVDCVMGTGFGGKPRKGIPELLERMSSSDALLISADVPSGFGSEHALVPDATVAFHDVKEGMDVGNCGTIFVSDIGIPEKAATYVGPGDMLRYPIPGSRSRKGNNGRVLVIGGGPYVGAPALSALGALGVGADLVTVATPSPSFIPIASLSPSYMVRDLGGEIFSKSSFTRLPPLNSFDAVLIGPGLGKHPATMEAVVEFVKGCPAPVIADADAIDALAGSGVYPAVVTPHAKEMERLHGAGTKGADAYAGLGGTTVLLKGPVDHITDGGRRRKNDTGNAAMTVGGTGDVLAGIVAGLLSKGMGPFDSACLAAYIAGRAGELAFEGSSYGMTAEDVAEAVSWVLSLEL
ncbi:MAG: NAD(P)H-hydrate dehydratase [Thermoplasmatales archaeon]|nr:NAD(P)H-hydrate dehydratase [Thermoplasmatales archaeon]